MGNWVIKWNFNKATYSPGEGASVSFWLENTGNTQVYLSDFRLEFDFATYNLESISGAVIPGMSRFLGSVNLLLPKNVVGRKAFRLKYRMHESANNSWIDLGVYQPDEQYLISIYPTPLYRVFLSRGLTTEDRVVGDPIAEMTQEWGFETVTVGIEVNVPEELVPARTKEEIKKSDAIIAIATPRFLDALTGLWKTLEWHHGEVGIAFGIDKPLLILKDRNISLGGLPSYLASSRQASLIEFDPRNLDELKLGLSAVMPYFREWTKTQRRQEFIETLKRIAISGLAAVGAVVVANGIIGKLSGGSKKEPEKESEHVL